MRIKVHPHKPMVDAGVESCVSITPMKKYGRAHYMGTVIMTDTSFVVHASEHARFLKEGQRNVHAWLTGELVSEAVEQFRPSAVDKALMSHVRYDLESGRFIAADGTDVTDGTFRAGVVVGKDCFISKDW